MSRRWVDDLVLTGIMGGLVFAVEWWWPVCRSASSVAVLAAIWYFLGRVAVRTGH